MAACVDEELRLLSEEIWKNPELALQEHKAHKLLSDFLEKKGFSVERKFCGVATAFRARSVTEPLGGSRSCIAYCKL